MAELRCRKISHSAVLPLGKGDNVNFRRKYKRNYKVESGILYYRKYSTQPAAVKEPAECVRTDEEKQRVMVSCHGSALGEFIFCPDMNQTQCTVASRYN